MNTLVCLFMGVAWVAYRFGRMAPGEVSEVFLHPFPEDKFIQFDLSVSSGNLPGFHPAARLEVLSIDDHVDGKGYLLRFTNLSYSNGGRPAPLVDLLAFMEDLS